MNFYFDMSCFTMTKLIKTHKKKWDSTGDISNMVGFRIPPLPSAPNQDAISKFFANSLTKESLIQKREKGAGFVA